MLFRSILEKSGELAIAERLCRDGLALTPDAHELRCTLGNILNAEGRVNEAIDEYGKVVASCDGKTVALSNALLSSLYLDDIPEEELFSRYRRWADIVERPLLSPASPKTPSAGRRLRIGYLSPDFKRHSVAFFIEPVLALHDKSRFEVFCYSDVASPDSITVRIKGLPEHWREINGMGDDALFDMLRADRLDILFDLAGHTGRRLRVFARRPAPVQATWIGYAATTGMSSMDFRLTDELADPQGTDRFHSERLVRLPGQFLVFSPPDDAPTLREAPCLKNGYVTFGSFNALPKISPSCLRLWASVLKAVPGSRMVIKGKPLVDASVRKRLLDAFAVEGIGQERLDLLKFEGSFASHLDTYSQVDIALDSYPYNGTTTTCEAFWMGVPTISLAGQAHRARVGLSLLNALGLPSLAVGSPGDFVGVAKALSSDLRQLAAFKASLRGAMASSPLCDAQGFVAKFEAALPLMFGA